MASSAHKTRLVAGIPVIDTPLVQSALDFARTHNDAMSFNHVHRSWVFGSLLASKLPEFAQTDLEVHAVSAILHDLAWDHKSIFSTPDKRFEVDGANAARDFLKRQASHFNDRQRQLVWDSIALHTTPSLARHKELEVALCNMGISADFAGYEFPGGLISREEYRAVVGELPHLGFKEEFKKLMCGLCVHKPDTTYDNYVRDFGERFVEGYSMQGKTSVDRLMKELV
ncbi:hypothetical protein N7532_002650 [Penicillium argentinense]|uniref:HD domain-containing protein n=1 Tax=Penicillium argentinense TaxID=1131581 RepID=A0A9W9G0S5_9EURO|nr:uncharacterized protein N7532_002650 [Penicillium argentinense]KAJ5110005.1 hypothetical protein N7532_002650 [Penicillium argentinense]